MVFQDSTNLNNISKYIVDKNGGTPYITIQSAIDAANAAGGGIVYVRPGNYTENLTCYDKIQVIGSPSYPTTEIKLVGIHTPSIGLGKFTFANLYLSNTTHIFSSTVAGTGTLTIKNCMIDIGNGYTYDLPNWTNTLEIIDSESLPSINNGCINNTTGGCVVRLIRSRCGDGTGNNLNISGPFEIQDCEILCGTVLLLNAGSTFKNIINTKFFNTLSIGNTAQANIINCYFDVGANLAINHTSTGILTLTETTIDSTSSTDAIGGTGTIEIGSITYLNTYAKAGTIVEDKSTRFEIGQLDAVNMEEQVFSGFRSWGGSGSYYTVSVTDFTVDRPGDGYIKSELISWVGAQTVSSLSKGNTHYIYIDNTGTIGSTITWSESLFENNIVLFEVLVDNDTPANVIVVRENHPYSFPTEQSLYEHRSVGPVIADFNRGANIVLNGTDGIEISGVDYLEDHGLETIIPDSGGSPETWNFMYTDSGGKWILNSSTATFPSIYNNAGTVTALGTNKFGVFRLYASKDDIESATPKYFAVIHTAEFNSLALAQTAVANGLIDAATNELFEIELAQLGYVIYEESTSSIDDVIIQKGVIRGNTVTTGTNIAALVTTDTSGFDGWLSAADTSVQSALNTLDDQGKGIIIDPGASGDSYVQFDINTTNEFRIGIDDDAADAFKISQGGALGTNDTFIMTSAGERTMPLQPAFLAYNSVSDTNVTGDGTNYTVICDTEVFDQNSDYNNTTGIFTAPVTGKYQFNFSVRAAGITIGHTNGRIQLVTSNRTYTPIKLNYATGATSSDDLTESGSLLADMDAGDTARLDIQISNGTLVIDIAGGADPVTFFSGSLIC